MSVNNSAPAFSSSRGAATHNTASTGPTFNQAPADLQKTAEVNAKYADSVQQFPKQATPPKDGVDPPHPAAGPGATGNPNADVKPPPNGSGAVPPDNTKELVAQVNQWTPSQLMTMLREGKIPEDIAANPQAMNLFLTRIQEFSRMVQLMTNLLQVQHETLMSIIRNIKA